MRIQRRWLTGLLLATSFTMGGVLGASAQDDEGLAYYRQAKIDWRQAEGQSLTIGLNKHPFTESLLPLIPEFRQPDGHQCRVPDPARGGILHQARRRSVAAARGILGHHDRPGPELAVRVAGLDPAAGRLPQQSEADRLGWYKLDDFYPALIAANRWNGKTGGGVGEGPLYSIPVLEESYILAYRKDIFDQYNIKVPTTLEEMVEAARLVKKNTGLPGIVARGTPSVASMGTGFMSGLKAYTDGKWSEFDDKLNANFHDPRSVKFTETWIDMVRESGPPNWANMQWYDAMEAFTAGQAGMIVDADFFAANYEDPKKSKVAGKVGYALIPAGPDGKPYAGLWTWALGISKATKNKEAAWLFVQWATAQRTLLNATLGYRNYNPARKSIMDDPRVQEIMGSWGGGSYLKVVAKNLETARVAWTPQSERTRMGDIWARALHEIYFKRMSAADALKKASNETDKVLKEAGIK